MKKFNYRKFVVYVLPVLAVFMYSANHAYAAPPAQPASAGKFEPGKGTKSEAGYQGHAGSPFYEYGKGIQIGALNLKPSMEYIASWEDNVFYDETDEKSDFIHRIEPGFTAELPIDGGRHLFSGSYFANIERYNDFGEEDHVDQKVNASLDLNYVPFSLNLADTFSFTVARADTEFTSLTKREENQFNSLLEIPFAAFFLETELNDYQIHFGEDPNKVFDYNALTFVQRVGLDVAPTTQALAEYAYTNLDYDRGSDRDGDVNQFSLGLRGNLGTRTTYQAWGGAQFRIYDLDSRPDFNGFVFRSALQYDITDKSNILLKASREPRESTFDNQSFYVRNRVEAAWKQQLAERLFFNPQVLYDYNTYSRTTVRSGVDRVRKDSVWQTILRLEYFMPNELVSFFGEYKFNGRDSNTATLDYDANSLSLGVKALF